MRTHGTYSAYTGGCRCSGCRAANREYKTMLRRRKGIPERVPAVADHGTDSCYTHHHCRCDACRAAHAAYCAKRQAERADEFLAGLVDVPHGTVSTYRNYRCRCAACTEANSAACREYARRRKERAA